MHSFACFNNPVLAAWTLFLHNCIQQTAGDYIDGGRHARFAGGPSTPVLARSASWLETSSPPHLVVILACWIKSSS